MRKMLGMIAIVLSFCCLCGCAKENVESEEIKQDSQYEAIIEEPKSSGENKKTEENNKTRGIGAALVVEGYREDRAWVYSNQISDKADWYVLDKEGNVLAGFPALSVMRTSFDDGFAHVKKDDVCYVLDENCNVVGRMQYSYGEEDVVSFGGGYTVIKRDISNFDTVGYEYTIYNVDGSVNGSFVTERERDVNYLGKGVFATSEGIYCAKGSRWIADLSISSFHPYTFENEQSVITTTYDSENGYGGIILLSMQGKVSTVYSESLSNNIVVSNVVDNVCVIFDLSYDKIYSFNVISGEIYELPETYYGKIPSWVWNNKPPVPNDGRIVIQLNGADGESYSAIFDTQFNLIAGPVLGSFGNSYEGYIRAAVNRDMLESEVYDKNGNFVYSISELNYSTYGEEYSCGAIAVRNGRNEYAFLDENGNYLFDCINLDGMKIIDIE